MNKRPSYSYKFEKQLLKFIRDYRLFDVSTPLFVAVSGGLDSMVLLHLVVNLKRFGYSNTIKVLHVNHGTRIGQEQDQKLVAKICKGFGIACEVLALKNMQGADFENRARIKRYEFFKEQASNGKLLLAHHIDDSLEWSLMQQFKSSNLKSSIGIPVKNGNIVRPLMAFSRRQLEDYASENKIAYRHDPSNDSSAYERNRMRKYLVNFRDEYPSMLKNYVERQNQLAQKLGLHAKQGQENLIVRRDLTATHIINLMQDFDENALKEAVREAIHNLSPGNRGKIREQLSRVIQMVKNQKFGPLNMTGGLKVFHHWGHLLVVSEVPEKVPITRPKLPFSTMDLPTFEKTLLQRLTSKDGPPTYPYWILLESRDWVKLPKLGVEPGAACWIYADECEYCVISAGNLLKQWRKKHNLSKRISLQFAQTGTCA